MPFRGLGDQHEKEFFGTRTGPLQHQLRKGEYTLFKYSPMFESDFVQISKHGGPVEIHNQEQIVTVAITTTNDHLLIPDILLLARPIYLSEDPAKFHRGDCKVKYELSRLFPLRLVKISVHNAERQQLKFKLASGRTFYLQLCPESYKREELFYTWTRMIEFLWPPSETKFEREEFRRIQNSPSPSSIAPSPKPTSMSMISWSDYSITKSLTEDEGNREPSKAKSSTKEPAPHPRAEEEAELLSSLPSHTYEMIERSEEELEERSPSHGTEAVEEEEGHERSHTSKRRSTKGSRSRRSRSRQRGAARKPSKLLTLIRSCSWGNAEQKRHAVRSRSKEKKWSRR